MRAAAARRGRHLPTVRVEDHGHKDVELSRLAVDDVDELLAAVVLAEARHPNTPSWLPTGSISACPLPPPLAPHCSVLCCSSAAPRATAA